MGTGNDGTCVGPSCVPIECLLACARRLDVCLYVFQTPRVMMNTCTSRTTCVLFCWFVVLEQWKKRETETLTTIQYTIHAGDQGQMDRSIVVKVPDEGMYSMSPYTHSYDDWYYRTYMCM